MTHHVELLMPADCPDEHAGVSSHEDLVAGPWLEFLWPVSALPAEMGTIHDAQRIAGDPCGGYYAPVSVAFYEEYVRLYCESAEGEEKVRLGYDDLAVVLGGPLLRVYREPDTSVLTNGATPPQRHAAFLRITPVSEDPIPRYSAGPSATS